MKVLQVNKYFYVRGGSERYYFDLCDLLAGRGHEVFHFSMTHSRNRPSPQADMFMSHVDLNAPMSATERVAAAGRLLYSREATRRMEAIIDRYRPDVVHMHNISRQITPSIVSVTSARGIPTVKTQHDYSLVCPAHTCFVNGEVCEDCLGGAYWHAVPKKCIDGSLTSSLLGAAEAYLHDVMGLYKKIDFIISPSRFLMEKLSSLKWIRRKIGHLPYLIPLGEDWSSRNDGYVLYSGRITHEKGVKTLLEAAARMPDMKFIIAGEGPQLDEFKEYARDRGLGNVEFRGYVEGGEHEALLEGAACIAVTSISYENLPLSILESFARGKPVVGSDCGGTVELVKDGETGFRYRRADADSLAEAIGNLLSDESARVRMARNARELVSGVCSPDYHYDRMMEIYARVGACE
ncbi:MAG: glycosyltransferase family 4 protein [bacterium]|jgi:glycosyltransferase involved in cell wall biosynthesis